MSKIFFALLVVFLCGACTAIEEVGTDVTQKFEEGITGHGRLVAPDPMADEFGPYYR
jgi:hypothetical protein